ncbi:hypothetical protein BCR43DRAFT_438944, partial [Syncephalastrum racemosum]
TKVYDTTLACWGAGLACKPLSKNYAQLVAWRILLGFFEVTGVPCLVPFDHFILSVIRASDPIWLVLCHGRSQCSVGQLHRLWYRNYQWRWWPSRSE